MVSRSIASTLMWVTYLGMVAALGGSLGNWIILLAFVLMIPLIAMTGMMWGVFKEDGASASRSQESQDDMEKRKRERIDTVLRDMSDDDLRRLKRRLETGAISDEHLYANLVGDDGELVDYSG